MQKSVFDLFLFSLGALYFASLLVELSCIESNRIIYLRHLTLGTVKLLHAYMHSLTPAFLDYYSRKLPNNPPYDLSFFI